MKRIAAIALSLSLLLVTLAGCSNPPGGGSTNTPSADPSASIPSTGSPEGAKKIGLVQINTTNSYYVGASEAFHKGAEDFGYELDEQFAENSLEEEISIIENFIELGYDMIIADPQDAEALEDVFQKGRDAGVIMVSLRSPMANADYNCLINHYNGFYGSAVACFEALGGEGKVLLMQGQVGHEASDSRTEPSMTCWSCIPTSSCWTPSPATGTPPRP